jgi:hypothetical protein
MGSKRKSSKHTKAKQPVCLQAQGADGGTKRTPLHVGDRAAGQQQYEVEVTTQELRLIGTSKRSHRSQTWGPICWCGGGTQGPSSIQMLLEWLDAVNSAKHVNVVGLAVAVAGW